MEDRRKTGGEAFHKDLEHHVGLRDPVVWPGQGNVVDLHEERSLVDGAKLQRPPIQRPAIPARGVRRKRGLDGRSHGGGLRRGRSTRSRRG